MVNTSAFVRQPDKQFILFWIGQLISALGSSFSNFALPLLVYRLTGSALDLALSSAISFVPYVLFGLIIGAWVDRANRWRLMLGVDLLRALLIASIPLMAALGLFSLWYLYAVQFVVATLSIGYDTARVGALVGLVERNGLVAANGRMIAGYSAASVLGPLLAGLMVAFVPLQTLLLVDTGSFLLSALTLGILWRSFDTNNSLLELSPQAQPPVSPFLRLHRDIASGVRYVWEQPVLRSIALLMLMLNIVGPTARVQLIVFAKEQLGASDPQVGFLSAGASIGVIAASLAAARIPGQALGRYALGMLCIQGLLLLVFSQMDHYWSALVIWSAMAGCGVIVDITIMSLRQTIAPGAMLGRVTTVTRTIGFAAIPLNTIVGGLLIDRFDDIRSVYAVIAILTSLIGCLFLLSPLRRAEHAGMF